MDAFIEQLTSDWGKWLRLRYPDLSSQHEDIIQTAIGDLLLMEKRRPSPRSDDERRAIGFTILKRRVADHFRGQFLASKAQSQGRDAEDLPNDASDPPREVAMIDLLIKVTSELDRMKQRDRALLLGPELGSDGTLTDAERQRRLRLRDALRATLFKKYRIDVSDILGG